MIFGEPRRYWIGLQGEVLSNASALIRGANGNKYWHVILFSHLSYLFSPFFSFIVARGRGCVSVGMKMDLNEIFFCSFFLSRPLSSARLLSLFRFLSLTWRVSFLLDENTVPFPPRQITISESREREKVKSMGDLRVGGWNENKRSFVSFQFFFLPFI